MNSLRKYVAEFIGDANVIKTTVKSIDEDKKLFVTFCLVKLFYR